MKQRVDDPGEHPPAHLSRCQRQRVAVADAFVDVDPLLGLEADAGEGDADGAHRLDGALPAVDDGGVNEPAEAVRGEEVMDGDIAR